jgi:hypothetical protein
VKCVVSELGTFACQLLSVPKVPILNDCALWRIRDSTTFRVHLKSSRVKNRLIRGGQRMARGCVLMILIEAGMTFINFSFIYTVYIYTRTQLE